LKRDIVIDADHILYLCTESRDFKSDLEGESLEDDVLQLKQMKQMFKNKIADYVGIAQVESVFHDWKIGKTRVILSDNRNFRYNLFSEYKSKRPTTPTLQKKLKKWAMKKYHFEPNTEADDVVAYYVRKGGIGFTTDKDLFKGVAGIWFNTHFKHQCWVYTTEFTAINFFKCQVLAGDLGDGIPSIAGVGLKTAEKLMAKHGSSWANIVSIFEDKGYTKEYMLTMTRLVCMSQWTPKKGITLWKIPK